MCIKDFVDKERREKLQNLEEYMCQEMLGIQVTYTDIGESQVLKETVLMWTQAT